MVSERLMGKLWNYEGPLKIDLDLKPDLISSASSNAERVDSMQASDVYMTVFHIDQWHINIDLVCLLCDVSNVCKDKYKPE